MSLQSITNLNVDFNETKYILINAKQHDKNSRFLSVTCYNHGEIYRLNSGEHSAYVRYKKADNYGVFNACNIDFKGKILVELTEQMLAADGICYAELVIVNKGGAIVDANTGEITMIEDASILSTMTFCINVQETSVTNAEIESSYEYNGLNEALEKAEAEYTNVIRMAKSYTEGHAGGIRENENTDNAEYYYTQSRNNSEASSINATNAINSANAAWSHMNAASASEQNAWTYKEAAEDYKEAANSSAGKAADSAEAAADSAEAAARSEVTAVNSASSASTSASNAENYYLQAKAITEGLNGAFLPMGTITFEELMALKENDSLGAGYLYNISNNFTTDESFKIGAGTEYTAGTNVYFTADGYFDCLAGAVVTGVKGSAEPAFRVGNVEITVENIGAIPSADIASVDEMKTYLGI